MEGSGALELVAEVVLEEGHKVAVGLLQAQEVVAHGGHPEVDETLLRVRPAGGDVNADLVGGEGAVHDGVVGCAEYVAAAGATFLGGVKGLVVAEEGL